MHVTSDGASCLRIPATSSECVRACMTHLRTKTDRQTERQRDKNTFACSRVSATYTVRAILFASEFWQKFIGHVNDIDRGKWSVLCILM